MADHPEYGAAGISWRKHHGRKRLLFLRPGGDSLSLRVLYRPGIGQMASGQLKSPGSKTVRFFHEQNGHDPDGTAFFLSSAFSECSCIAGISALGAGTGFQGRLPEMLLVILTGCIMGVSLGILVLSIGKWQEKIKSGLCWDHNDCRISGRTYVCPDEVYRGPICAGHQPFQSGSADRRRVLLYQCIRRSVTVCPGSAHTVCYVCGNAGSIGSGRQEGTI